MPNAGAKRRQKTFTKYYVLYATGQKGKKWWLGGPVQV